MVAMKGVLHVMKGHSLLELPRSIENERITSAASARQFSIRSVENKQKRTKSAEHTSHRSHQERKRLPQHSQRRRRRWIFAQLSNADLLRNPTRCSTPDRQVPLGHLVMSESFVSPEGKKNERMNHARTRAHKGTS